jgi:hypothetical protein
MMAKLLSALGWEVESSFDYYYYYHHHHHPNFSLLSFSWEIFTYPGMYHQQD